MRQAGVARPWTEYPRIRFSVTAGNPPALVWDGTASKVAVRTRETMIRTRVFIVVVPHTAAVRYAKVKTHTPRNIPTCARTERPGPMLQVSWIATELGREALRDRAYKFV